MKHAVSHGPAIEIAVCAPSNLKMFILGRFRQRSAARWGWSWSIGGRRDVRHLWFRLEVDNSWNVAFDNDVNRDVGGRTTATCS